MNIIDDDTIETMISKPSVNKDEKSDLAPNASNRVIADVIITSPFGEPKNDDEDYCDQVDEEWYAEDFEEETDDKKTQESLAVLKLQSFRKPSNNVQSECYHCNRDINAEEFKGEINVPENDDEGEWYFDPKVCFDPTMYLFMEIKYPI